MKYSGIIFDFNGTLFFDSDKQEDSWRIFSEKLRGTAFTDEELHNQMHGRTNKYLIEYLLGKSIDDESHAKYSEEKEKIYRDMCIKDVDNFKLAPGVVDFLDYLKENNIPRTIATASGKINVLFFIESFGLDKWFDTDKIVYDDGTIPGKPEPDIYLKAASMLNLQPEKCIVFEDAVSGIESARRAGIGKIVAIGTSEKHEKLKKIDGVKCVISDFTEIDKSIFQ